MSFWRFPTSGARGFALVTCFGVLFGCATGEDPPDPNTGGAPPTGLAAYTHRRVIKLTPNTPADFAIAFTIDHAALVNDELALADGSDLRVGFETDTDAYEIDRVLDTATDWNTGSTVIWFRTQSTPDAGEHYVYYGEDDPTGVVDDPARVFDAYEAFDGDTLQEAWSIHEIGGATGSAAVGDGVVRFSATAGDLGGVNDSVAVLGESISGDFVLDVAVRSVGGSLGAGAKAGGLMLRQSPLDDARFTMIGLSDTPRQRFTATRSVDGEAVTQQAVDVPELFPQLFSIQRTGDDFAMFYSDDAIRWISLGDVQTVEMLDPVIAGFPIANLSAGNAHVEIDYVRQRSAASPTPTADLGAQEEL